MQGFRGRLCDKSGLLCKLSQFFLSYCILVFHKVSLGKKKNTFGPLLRQIEKIANHLEMTSRCGIFPDESFCSNCVIFHELCDFPWIVQWNAFEVNCAKSHHRVITEGLTTLKHLNESLHSNLMTTLHQTTTPLIQPPLHCSYMYYLQALLNGPKEMLSQSCSSIAF